MMMNPPVVGSRRRDLLAGIVTLHSKEHGPFGWTRCAECKKPYPCPTVQIASSR